MNILDRVATTLGYEKRTPIVATPQAVEKADREGMAQNPLAAAYAAVNTQWGLRRPSKITLQTLRQMSMANWVDRACIVTLRDEITGIPWDIVPIDPKKPYNPVFQKLIIRLLKQPNRNNENWRTLIDKVMEDILVVDAGTIEKVRNGKGQVVELYHVDGATIKPKFDEHGMAGDPAYEQWLPGQKSDKPQATWTNDDLVYIMWNPQGAVDMFGYGMSPVEAGLAVGTAFLYAEAYNMGFFKTNTIPPVIINMGKDVNANQVESFKSFLAAEMGGTNGFHQPVIGSFGDGFDIKTLLANPKDMAWKEYVEWQMKWKVALYRMSPQDIGFSLDQYKVQGDTQLQLSKNKAIRSLQNVIAEFINREIIEDWGYDGANDNLQFQWIDTDTVDPLVQAQIDQIYLTSGKISINELRRRDGEDPIQGGAKPTILLGSQILPLDATPLEDDDNEESSDSVQKTFAPQEGQIVSLAGNETAIAWMDDRGVTQPFFVADFGKTHGFAVKPAFLDDKKGQEPPEQKVAEMLRLLKVNTPDVRIMSGDDVLKLLPLTLYSNWARYLSVDAPFYSREWIDRWGTSRKSAYYIVSGLITGKDLGNDDLQKAMQASPESYFGAVKDLARVWLAERRFYLGDRKPGHYLITDSFTGFGVDYQFYEDQHSWEKTNHFLPDTLKLIHPDLLTCFLDAIKDEAASIGFTKSALLKSFRPGQPKGWMKEQDLDTVEKPLAMATQKRLAMWYSKAVHVPSIPIHKTEEEAQDGQARV